MKKRIFLSIFISIGIFVSLLVSNGSAKQYGMAGCGLGAVVIGPKPGMIQIVAATTNNILVPQTSAISTGTSKCQEDGVVVAHAQQTVYVANNLSSLQIDIAKGKGEKLNSLAYLMGCSVKSFETFGNVAKKNYGTIFSEQNSPDMVLYQLKKVVKSDDSLGSICTKIWL